MSSLTYFIKFWLGSHTLLVMVWYKFWFRLIVKFTSGWPWETTKTRVRVNVWWFRKFNVFFVFYSFWHLPRKSRYQNKFLIPKLRSKSKPFSCCYRQKKFSICACLFMICQCCCCFFSVLLLLFFSLIWIGVSFSSNSFQFHC